MEKIEPKIRKMLQKKDKRLARWISLKLLEGEVLPGVEVIEDVK